MESSLQDHPRPPPRRTSTVRGRRPGFHHPRQQGNRAQLPRIYHTTRNTDSKSGAFKKVTAQSVAAARSEEQRFSPGERKNSRQRETKLPDEALNRENGTQGHRQHRHRVVRSFRLECQCCRQAIVGPGQERGPAEQGTLMPSTKHPPHAGETQNDQSAAGGIGSGRQTAGSPGRDDVAPDTAGGPGKDGRNTAHIGTPGELGAAQATTLQAQIEPGWA
jgi:hypothetical protein